MLQIKSTKTFEKDVKCSKKRDKNLEKFKDAKRLFAEEKQLPPKYKDHLLSGNYVNRRECYIESDSLLI